MNFFYKQFRTSPTRYEKLLNLIAPLITKSTTAAREPIGPFEMLCITLRYLSAGV